MADARMHAAECDMMKDALGAENSLIIVQPNGITYGTVGFVDRGRGQETWFLDLAFLFCPFCGTRLHTIEEIRSSRAKRAGPER